MQQCLSRFIKKNYSKVALGPLIDLLSLSFDSFHVKGHFLQLKSWNLTISFLLRFLFLRNSEFLIGSSVPGTKTSQEIELTVPRLPKCFEISPVKVSTFK